MSDQKNLLNSPAFRQAVSGIQRRAEKQTDWARLADVFVKTDLLDRVGTPNSQLILGRRGTGKTHLIRMFQQQVLQCGQLAFYLDCTRLGSGFGGLTLTPEAIGQKYFISLLNQLGTDMLDEASRMELPEKAKQDVILSKLANGLVPWMQSSDQEGFPTFNYRQISDVLQGILDDLKIPQAAIILDEWAQVPFSAQPILAEYLKRAILTVSGITIKIVAVNYQCQFFSRSDSAIIGLQRGTDIPDTIDMDRYLVYDEKRDFVAEFFAQVLFNHLGVELKWNVAVAPEEKRKSVEALFTQQRAFIELVRAAEGNCRDFLCIFARAYFDEYRQSQTSHAISIPNITKAASSWYDTEKASSINADQMTRETITFLWKKVLKDYKSRTFLVEASKVDHIRLTRLLNERVLHRLNGTYSHKDKPGVLHELFTIDYGAFVRFRNTVNEVPENVFWLDEGQAEVSAEEKELLVPVDDKRSIRRIVFDPDSLDIIGPKKSGKLGEGEFSFGEV